MDMNPANSFLLPPMKGRKAPPSHCLFKIQSFSLLSKALVETYTSEEFEAGGYKWKLSIYPTGNKKKDGQDHISIYLNLTVMDSSSFPIGWEVNAIVNFFAYDFVLDEYCSAQDASIRRFHALQTEWGIPKFIDLATFNDPSNGFLIDDACVFGAEVFIVKATCKGDYLSVIDKPSTLSYTWKFLNFSYASNETYESQNFVAGNYQWKLILYPNGCVEGKGNSISLFLSLNISSLPPNTKIYVHCILRARDQMKGQHVETEFRRHYSKTHWDWGSRLFVPLAKLKDPTMGFIVGDCCIFEAEFKVLGLIKPFND